MDKRDQETLKRELRMCCVRGLPFDLRADEDGERVLRGYAAVFNRWSEDLGWFIEQIAPGAFKNSLKNDDIRSLWNHDTADVLGRNMAKTLELKEDDTGLAIKIMLPDTQSGRDHYATVKRGDVSQMSFGFTTIADAWRWEKDKTPERTLEEVRLWEVSPVTFPAYPDTSIAARSMDHEKKAVFGWRESLDLRRRALDVESVA